MALNTDKAEPVQAPLAVGSLVYDKADPSRHGKVIRSGPEVSEVRYKQIKRKYPNIPKTEGLLS
jgi:hypothetical protein